MDLEKLHRLNDERREWLSELAARQLMSRVEIGQMFDTQAAELARRHQATMARMEEVCARLGLTEGNEGKASLMVALSADGTEALNAEVDNSQPTIEVGYFVSNVGDTMPLDRLDGTDDFNNRFDAVGTGAHIVFFEGEASWNTWWDEDITLADKQRVLSSAKEKVSDLENTSLMLLAALTPEPGPS